jgi:hypothetical protein
MSTFGEGKSEIEVVKLATLQMMMTLTPEQYRQVAELLLLVKDRAILRQCSQTLSVEINDKGYVRFFHASDNVAAIKPVAIKDQP